MTDRLIAIAVIPLWLTATVGMAAWVAVLWPSAVAEEVLR